MTVIVPPRAVEQRFSAVWNGKRIGAHRVAVHLSACGGAMTVTTEIELAVKLGPITLYRYRHRSQERWGSGRLQAIASRTEDDGDVYTVEGAIGEHGFLLRGPHGQHTATGPLLTSNSLWTRAITRERRIIDAQRGVVVALRIVAEPSPEREPAGAIDAAHFRFQTPDWCGSLWYDNERWVRAVLTRNGHTMMLDPAV